MAPPPRILVECGEVGWRARGGLTALFILGVVLAWKAPGGSYASYAEAFIEALAIGGLAGPITGIAYVAATATTVEQAIASLIGIIAGTRLGVVRDRWIGTLFSMTVHGRLPRPTAIAAAALGLYITAWQPLPGLPEEIRSLYVALGALAASTSVTTLESLVLGFIAGLHPAAAAAASSYVAQQPRCYGCGGLRLWGFRLWGSLRGSRLSCLRGEPELGMGERIMIVVYGSYSLAIGEMIAAATGAKLYLATTRGDFEEALRMIAEERPRAVVLASTYTAYEELLPAAPGYDAALVVSGARDPMFLARLKEALKVGGPAFEQFVSKPGRALAYPGCQGEVLLLELEGRVKRGLIASESNPPRH